jgi:hypothetical protein
MSHDKIKAAVRRRMAATGESYAIARREDIKKHAAARHVIPDTSEIQRIAALVPDTSEIQRIAALVPDTSEIQRIAAWLRNMYWD